MSTTALENPIPTYRFYVFVENEEIEFNNVSGLNMTRPTIEYRDGMGGGGKMSGQMDATNITLRKGIFSGQTGFYHWISSISLNTVEKKDVTITMMNEAGSQALVTWSIVDAFPTSLTASGLDATSNEGVIEELSLSAKSVSVTFRGI